MRLKKNESGLAKARLAVGLKQLDAALQVGVTELHLLRVERGAETLTNPMRAKLAKLYKISEDTVQRRHKQARDLYLKTLDKPA